MPRLVPFRRPSRRTVARAALALSVVVTLAAAGLAAYPATTDRYQARLQRRLVTRLASTDLAQRYRDRRVARGDSLTRLVIPRLDLDVVVVEGTSASALRAGAGHYPQTPLPGEAGNVGIAGHRTTYGKPFADLDRLRPGDDIVLATPVGRFTYRVTAPPFVVPRNDWSVVAATPGHALTLTACHPKRSAHQRIVVRAALMPAAAAEGA